MEAPISNSVQQLLDALRKQKKIEDDLARGTGPSQFYNQKPMPTPSPPSHMSSTAQQPNYGQPVPPPIPKRRSSGVPVDPKDLVIGNEYFLKHQQIGDVIVTYVKFDSHTHPRCYRFLAGLYGYVSGEHQDVLDLVTYIEGTQPDLDNSVPSAVPSPPNATAAARKCSNHDYVDVGFMHLRMACRHCGIDQLPEPQDVAPNTWAY